MEHRPQVDKLADEMERRLAAHDEDRDRDGWLGEPLEYLHIRLRTEVAELVLAIANQEGSESVWREAADVANFAMMLADNYEVMYR